MLGTTIGDLAQHFLLRQHNASVQSVLNDRVNELASGEVSDVSKHLSGNFTAISGVERSLALSESYASIIVSAKTFADGQVLAYEKARGFMAGTGVALVDAAESVDQVRRASVLAESRESFNSIIAALNSQSGGRSLFSGASTQTAAFASPDDIISSFSMALAGATTAGDVITIADTWFASGGDYDSSAYLGSAVPLGGFRIGQNSVVTPQVSGNDEEIREMLKLHAVSAVISEGGLGLIDAEKSNLMSDIGNAMINLDQKLIAVQADMGSLQSRIDRFEAENSSEIYSLMSARKDLIGVDTAEAAMRLTETEAQLEALYAVTARISRLSLAEYI